ncbi:MAG: hypothetical protein K5633_00835 [Paludibacteraceae bacterium]|nr:hypothetical protein [Paludibacteraceae bacterium]
MKLQRIADIWEENTFLSDKQKIKSPVFQGLCKVKLAENTEFLRLAVTTMGKVLELSAIAEPADVFLGGLGWNLQLFGYGQDIQRVEGGQE